jgi:hypothetical protein
VLTTGDDPEPLRASSWPTDGLLTPKQEAEKRAIVAVHAARVAEATPDADESEIRQRN